MGQFLPYWRDAGIDCDARYAYGDDYNRLRDTIVGAPYKLLWRLKRVPFAADADEFDFVFVQRPALPQSAFPERLLASINDRIVFDFDDSIHLGPGGVESPARAATMRDDVALARHVVAGNEYLASVAGMPEKTTVIPTVIDTERYVPDGRRAQGRTIGWMGTSGNFPFVEQIAEPMRRALARLPDWKFVMVSNAEFAPLSGHPQVEQIRWTAATEIPLLQSFDIGLMPLADGPLTRGKCAFKMIQYMAVGAPVVVSAVGANVEVFRGSDAGECVGSFDEFEDAVVALAENPERRAQCGEAGREHVDAGYSIRAVLPRYLEIFDGVAKA